MKNTFLITLFILHSILSFGQELKTKKKKVSTQEGKAIFYVLESNDTIKHGDYEIKAYTGSRILLKGSYQNNKKVGLWTEQYYGKNFKGPKATGNYDNDIKIGDWTYYDYEGEVTTIYDWTANKVVYSKLCGANLKKHNILENSTEVKTNLDCLPTCATGIEYFIYEFNREISEKAELFKQISTGVYQLKTKISFTIHEDASITDISYSTEEKRELKEIIEKYIKSFKWIPATKDSENVSSNVSFSVNLTSQF